MYGYAQPGLGDVAGLGSKLKKIAKKVEKVTRPITKVAAVVGTAMYAPALLPVVAGKVIKPKDPGPAPEAAPAPAPALPEMLPAVATPAAAGAAPPLPKLAPQLVQAAAPAAPAPMFAPAPVAGPSISITQPGQGDDGTKKLMVYGGMGLGALLLLMMATRQGQRN